MLIYDVFTAACGLAQGGTLGLMQSSWAIGYALAAVVTAVVMPTGGWRAVFFVGLIPALLTLWIRRYVEESPVWSPRRGGGFAALGSDT
jgi:MFS family permease